ncbi:hypothetical protein LFM09_35615 [Lentzea alba]|uniref:methyltransferase n=1 Tax=Lentzea alba TaxID=2714351 RepID=UPI0039BEF85E
MDRRPTAFETMHPLFVHLHAGHLLRTALELRLPDLVGEQPAPAAEIALAAGADPGLTARLFRALSGLGVFLRVGPDTYAHNDLSLLLRSGSGDATAAIVNAFLKPEWMWQVWAGLTDAVRSGACPFPSVHGNDFFGFLGDSPQVAEDFGRAMTLSLAAADPVVASTLDLGGVRHLVDIGGGQGALLRSVLHRHPGLRGTLFDIPAALADVDPELGCEIVAGDARESVPAADAYLFRLVLHNWDDETCVQMLSRCAEAGNAGARVFVVEALRTDDLFVSLMDLQMFLLLGGKERDEDEFAALFSRAGLRYRGARATASAFHVVEASLE